MRLSVSLLLASMLMFVQAVSGQERSDTISAAVAAKATGYLKDQSVALTPSQIVSVFRRAEPDWFDDSFGVPNKYQSAKRLNVLDYFNLNDSIDTELKRKVFLQTPEYAALLDSVKKAKAAYFSSTFYEYGFNEADLDPRTSFDEGNPGSYVFSTTEPSSDYNLAKKGFELKSADKRTTTGFHACNTSALPSVIAGIEFKQLPVFRKSDPYHSDPSSINSYEMLFVPMSEQLALDVENNRADVSVLRVFEITGDYIATIPNATYYESKNRPKVPCTVQVLKGGAMRLIIYNIKTDKVYYDKLYPVVKR